AKMKDELTKMEALTKDDLKKMEALAKMKEELMMKDELLKREDVRRRSAPATAGATARDGNVSRVTYTLPEAKAAALAEFIRDQLKPTVVETKLDGDKLTVTTTPEAQKAIAQLVDLIKGSSGVRYRLAPTTPEKPK